MIEAVRIPYILVVEEVNIVHDLFAQTKGEAANRNSDDLTFNPSNSLPLLFLADRKKGDAGADGFLWREESLAADGEALYPGFPSPVNALFLSPKLRDADIVDCPSISTRDSTYHQEGPVGLL